MSINSRAVIFWAVGFLALSSGCAATAPKSVTPPDPAQVPSVAIPEQPPSAEIQAPAPRTLASLRLTGQAEQLIAAGKPDEAIRVLEKSINVDPGNGRNYYFLAEALILKGNQGQAAEFNRLAGIYLKEDTEWTTKVVLQKARIEKMK